MGAPFYDRPMIVIMAASPNLAKSRAAKGFMTETALKLLLTITLAGR